MEPKTRKALSDQISDLCDQAGCSEKIRKIHAAQFVDRRWNPHPPQSFVAWWANRPEHADSGVDASRAFNSQNFRDQFMEAKSVGAA
jgi:hypothetical protein